MSDENLYNDEIKAIIKLYNKTVYGLDEKANNIQGRSYGGYIRSVKSALVVNIAKRIIELAWEKLEQDPDRLKICGKEIKIPIKQEYIDKLDNEEVKDYIEEHIEDYYYGYRPDILVEIDKTPVLAIECKAYTENAMLKRVLMDATLVKTQYPEIKFVLFQLESQLGSNISGSEDELYESHSAYTIASYFDVDLTIITLLEGERRVDEPIHKKGFFKPLTEERLQNAINIISSLLEEFSE